MWIMGKYTMLFRQCYLDNIYVDNVYVDNVYVYKVYVDNGEAAKEAADKAADETFEIFLKTHAAMHKCCACLYSKDETYIG